MHWRHLLLQPQAKLWLHCMLALPFAWMLWALFNDALGANPAEALSCQRDQAVVGGDEDSVLVGCAGGEPAPFAANLRVDDGEMNSGWEVGQRAAQYKRATAHVVALNSMSHVEDPRLRCPLSNYRVADADVLIGVAVVGEEGDRARHRLRVDPIEVARELHRANLPCRGIGDQRSDQTVRRVVARFDGRLVAKLAQLLARDRPD